VCAPEGQQAPPTNVQFMDQNVLDIFKYNAGGDVTKQLNSLRIDRNVLAWQKACLQNLFTIGKVDKRQSPQCLFATYILLVLSVIIVSVIGLKFLASINIGASRAPEDHDKFVICQVPCYTEGDTSLRKTIDALAQLKYDDTRHPHAQRSAPPSPLPCARYGEPACDNRSSEAFRRRVG
jgi:chitin synthase